MVRREQLKPKKAVKVNVKKGLYVDAEIAEAFNYLVENESVDPSFLFTKMADRFGLVGQVKSLKKERSDELALAATTTARRPDPAETGATKAGLGKVDLPEEGIGENDPYSEARG